MYSALAEYYKTSVEPQRATVLVQGGHGSGKTTVLNALLGHHIFPYFASRESGEGDNREKRLSHGGVGRFVAGLGSTAVCFLGVASADPSGQGLAATQASQGTIHSLVVPNTLATALAGLDSKAAQVDPHALSLAGGRVVTVNTAQRFSSSDALGHADAGDGHAPSPTAEHSVTFFGETSAFALADNIYAQDASGSWAATGSRPWDTQSFFYDAVESMERLWADWRRGLQDIDPACDPTDKPERMVLIATLQPGTSTPPVERGQFATEYPLMHFVESTDLADRPPMPYVHTAIAVLHERLDGLEAEDPEGARRMYLKSALYARTNVVPVLVFNLTERSANHVSNQELQLVRRSLASKYGLSLDSVFIFNAQRALADALLEREGIAPQAQADSNELDRLRRLIASNHLAAHDRMMLRRRQRQEQENSQAPRSAQSTAPGPQTTPAAPFLPRMLTENFVAEDTVLAHVASRAAGPADLCNGGTALPTPVTPELTVLLESQRDAAQQVMANNAVALSEAQEVIRRQSSYVPRIAAEDSAAIAPQTTQGRKTPPPMLPVQAPYVPKCVGERSVAESLAVGAVVERRQYVPKCVANGPSVAANPETATATLHHTEKPFAEGPRAATMPSEPLTREGDESAERKEGDTAAMSASTDSFELI